MLKPVETKGLVLFNRNYREEDKLVKIFTETAGKKMFFVKRFGKSKLAPVLQPLTLAYFLTKMADDGLSYIDDYADTKTYPLINQDIFKLAHASYLVGLADAALEDGEADPALFAFLEKTLDLMEQGLDEAVLTNIFEIQLLSRFGLALNFHECAFCHRSGLPFDFSFAYNGLLCPDHYDKDDKRLRLDPNVPYLIDLFQAVEFAELERITLSDETKRKLRAFIDLLYEDYLGLKLKQKKFLDSLDDWGTILKKEK